MDQRMGELLIEAGVLSAEQLEQVLKRQVTEGEARIASEIYALGLAHERQLCEALCRKHGHPAIVLSESVLDLGAMGLIPKVIAEKHMLLPVAVDDETLTVAVPDVDLGPILEQVQFASGRLVIPILAVKKIVEDAIGPAFTASHQGDKVLAGQAAHGQTEPFLSLVRDVPDDSPAAQQALSDGLVLSTAATDIAQLAAVFPAPTAEAAPVKSVPAPIPELEGAAGLPIAALDLVQVPVVRPAQVPNPAGLGEADEVDVVLAEDDDSIALLVTKALEHDGYSVRHAATGDEAAELLRRVSPRLILLDAMLPGVHGFELCSRAKRSQRFKNVPVVMISAVYKGWEQARDIQEVHMADAFVEKPFDVHFLRKLAAGYLGGELQRMPLQSEIAAQVKALQDAVAECFLMGDWGRADAAAREWTSLNPFDAHAHLEVGNIATQRGDLPAAMKAYEFATVYSPRSFAARTNLAMVYERLGFRRRAIDTWLVAIEHAPDEASMGRIEERLAALRT